MQLKDEIVEMTADDTENLHRSANSYYGCMVFCVLGAIAASLYFSGFSLVKMFNASAFPTQASFHLRNDALCGGLTFDLSCQ